MVRVRLVRSDAVADRSAESADNTNVRSLEECIEIFNNGPRPLSESLKLLNDQLEAWGFCANPRFTFAAQIEREFVHACSGGSADLSQWVRTKED